MSKCHDIYVSVTQRHIDAGKCKNCRACPISLALNECLKPDFHSFIEKMYITIEFSDRNIPQYSAYLAEIIYHFIKNFDEGKEVKPFVFMLSRVPARLIKF